MVKKSILLMLCSVGLSVMPTRAAEKSSSFETEAMRLAGCAAGTWLFNTMLPSRSQFSGTGVVVGTGVIYTAIHAVCHLPRWIAYRKHAGEIDALQRRIVALEEQQRENKNHFDALYRSTAENGGRIKVLIEESEAFKRNISRHVRQLQVHHETVARGLNEWMQRGQICQRDPFVVEDAPPAYAPAAYPSAPPPDRQ